MTSFINGKNTNNRIMKVLSTRQPAAIQRCGLSLVRLLDMICTKTRQILMRNGIYSSPSSPMKQQFKIKDYPSSRMASLINYISKFFSSLYECIIFIVLLRI